MEASEESANCAPAQIPANRLDLELIDIDKWPEAVNLAKDARLLMQAVPRPPTDEGVLLALESVEDFRLQISAAAAMNSTSPRPLKVAATAVTIILQDACEKHGLVGIPAAAKRYRKVRTRGDEELLLGVTPMPQVAQDIVVPGESDPPVIQPTGAPFILHYLTAVQRWAAAVVERSVSTMPFISYSLDEDMIADRHQHELFFKSADVIATAYDRLFKDARGDIKTLWSAHVNTAGRLSHPARLDGAAHYFDGQRWLGSVTSSRDVLRMGAPHPDHPLPDAPTLLLCFKTQSSSQSSHSGKRYRPADKEDKFYFLDKDVVGAIALLMGDTTYKLSLHLGDVIPELASGPHQLIPAADLPHRVLTLGLYLQYCVNYQTFVLKSVYKLFDVSEIHFCFSMPATHNHNLRKVITFHYDQKHLGEKRWAALPFLITCMGLRNYRAYTKDPDDYLANLRSPAASFIDEISGTISMAKEKVRRRLSLPAVSDLHILPLEATPPVPESPVIGMVMLFHIIFIFSLFFPKSHFCHCSKHIL